VINGDSYGGVLLSKEIAKLLAKNFIQRKDVKAVQLSSAGGGLSQGDWFPDTRIKRDNSPHLPVGFNMEHLLAHLSGERTYGHYMLDDDSKCKVFAFDIDLEKGGTYITLPDWNALPFEFYDNEVKQEQWFHENSTQTVVEGKSDLNLRDIWMSRKREHQAARTWFKYQMKHLAHILANKVVELEIPCAVAYSGSKGVHVYGFTGLTGVAEAKECREAAMLALDMTDEFEPLRGQHFFKHKNDDPVHGFSNFSVEVFPKQDTLDGKNLGNLMRLPLGTNWKNPKDPTFFLDMTTALGDFRPHSDPVKLLTEGNPFK
jgi:hypothetical protein